MANNSWKGSFVMTFLDDKLNYYMENYTNSNASSLKADLALEFENNRPSCYLKDILNSTDNSCEFELDFEYSKPYRYIKDCKILADDSIESSFEAKFLNGKWQKI